MAKAKPKKKVKATKAKKVSASSPTIGSLVEKMVKDTGMDRLKELGRLAKLGIKSRISLKKEVDLAFRQYAVDVLVKSGKKDMLTVRLRNLHRDNRKAKGKKVAF